MNRHATLKRATKAYREWIPCRERLPDEDGVYDTIVTALLDGERIPTVQRYERQAHPAISGWRCAPTTHWRAR